MAAFDVLPLASGGSVGGADEDVGDVLADADGEAAVVDGSGFGSAASSVHPDTVTTRASATTAAHARARCLSDTDVTPNK